MGTITTTTTTTTTATTTTNPTTPLTLKQKKSLKYFLWNILAKKLFIFRRGKKKVQNPSQKSDQNFIWTGEKFFLNGGDWRIYRISFVN